MTDEKKISVGVLCLLIVLYSIAAAPILIWPFVFFFSVILFDHPGDVPFTFSTFLTINSYPFIFSVFIVLSILCFIWRKNLLAILLVIIPLIALSIVICVVVNLIDEMRYSYLKRNTFITEEERQLITACAKGSADELSQQLKEGGPRFANIVGTEGMTPLMAACRSKRYDNVEVLLKHGADPNLIPRGKLENTAVYFLISRMNSYRFGNERKLDYLRLFWDHGLNPNLNDSENCILFEAVQLEDPKVLRLLLQRGADPHVVHDGRSVLSVGISWRSWENVLYLLENYPDLPLNGVQKALSDSVIERAMADESTRSLIEQILTLLEKREPSLRNRSR